MSKVYVITSGEYSSYCIEKIFLDKIKAEKYCKYHRNFQIEEYDTSDNDIYTLFKYVDIFYKFNISKYDFHIDISIKTAYREESTCYLEPWFHTSAYYEYITINYTHPINELEDEEKIKNKYMKVFQDITAEIKYFLSDYDLTKEDEKERALKNIQKRGKICSQYKKKIQKKFLQYMPFEMIKMGIQIF